MHVTKILYMANIYGLVTETKKKKFKKNYSGFYEKTAVKTILQRILVKNRCKMVFCSSCYIRTTVNNLQRFLTKSLLNFAALPITGFVQPLLTVRNNRCKSPFVV
jgi:hypothetical protein